MKLKDFLQYKKNDSNDKINRKEFFTTQNKIIALLFKKRPKEVVLIFLLLVGFSFESVVMAKFIETISNAVSNYVSGDTISIQEIYKPLIFYIVITIICLGIKWIYTFYSNRFNEYIRFDVENELREATSSIKYEHYENNSFHEKLFRAQEAGAQMGNAIYGCAQFVRILVLLLYYCVILGKLSILLSLMLVAISVITFFISVETTDMQLAYYRGKVSPSWRSMNYFEHITEPLENHQHIQANRLFSFFGKKYVDNKKEYLNNTLQMNKISFVTDFLMSILLVICFSFTMLFVGRKLVIGQVEIGFFVMLFTILIQMFDTIKEYSGIVTRRNWYIRTIEDYFDVIEYSRLGEQKIISEEIKEITFDGISYRYPQAQNDSLKDCSVTLKMGEKIAIVGYNGSGKTTFVNLFMGLLEQTDGTIKVNGKKIEKGSLKGYCGQVACVLQDFKQYQLTIKQNIELGNGMEPISDEKVWSIIEKVGLLSDVSKLSAGIDTPLGELNDGQELSMGQKQKMVIARLLANENARIWILDEPTAYLDPITEVNTYKLIRNLSEDKLVLFISHRLGYAAHADRILVFEDGKIVEDGTHDKLIKTGCLYSTMYEIQKEWYR